MTPEDMSQIVDSLLERGFELPIHFAAIGRNGSLIAGSYLPAEGDDTLEVRRNTSYGDGILALPINFMFVDSRGEAARVVIDTEGSRRFAN